MSNRRLYELDSKTYSEASGGYIIVDGNSYNSAYKVPVSEFAQYDYVENSLNELNDSAVDIASRVRVLQNSIPTIRSGFNDNVYVGFEDNQYYISGSNYDVTTNDLKLSIERIEEVGGVKFKISADTYTKEEIEEKLDELDNRYNVSGLNNIKVTTLTDEKYDNNFVVTFDGISVNKEDYSVVINDEANVAEVYSLSQGSFNNASSYSFAQGDGNNSQANSIAQGTNNESFSSSLAQGYGNVSHNLSFAQGENNIAYDKSIAQGDSNYASGVSLAFGVNNSASNHSFSLGDGGGEAYDHSLAFGENSYASGYSYNFYGDTVTNHSFSVGHNGLVSNHTTAFGQYNEPSIVSGDNPYTFALGNGDDAEHPNTFFWVNTSGVFYKRNENEIIEVTKAVEKITSATSFENYMNAPESVKKNGRVYIVS